MTLKRNTLKLTMHFVERYHERILNVNDKISFKRVYKDLDRRLTLAEKKSILLLVNEHVEKVKIPLGMINTMVIKNGTFVTVY